MSPVIRVQQLTTNSGDDLEILKYDVIVFVGPNNCGKSQALRDIVGHLTTQSYNSKVFQRVSFSKEGLYEEFEPHFKTHSEEDTYHVGQWRVPYQAAHRLVHLQNALAEWNHEHYPKPNIGWLFSKLIETENRLTKIKPPQHVNSDSRFRMELIQLLLPSDTQGIETKISNTFEGAFGKPLTVDRFANGRCFRVGGLGSAVYKGSEAATKLQSDLTDLPALQYQGDGMKSFATIVTEIELAPQSIILVDEPEAFLHPPQARYIGKWLAQKGQKPRQIFIATHDPYLVRGVLDAFRDNVAIIRLQRLEDTTIATVLKKENADEIWHDNWLRHSRALDAVFHDAVVLCEGDSDVYFYDAISECIDTEQSSSPSNTKKRIPDLLFAQCGGKGGIAKTVDSITNAGVPTLVIADIDLLSNADELKKIVIALGGKWDRISKHYKTLDGQVRGKIKPKSRTEIQVEIQRILDTLATDTVSNNALESIRAITQKVSPWDQIKSLGEGAIPRNDATKAYKNIRDYLRSIRLFLVPVGTLEGFNRELPTNKQEWLRTALASDLKDGREWTDARSFVNLVVDAARKRVS